MPAQETPVHDFLLFESSIVPSLPLTTAPSASSSSAASSKDNESRRLSTTTDASPTSAPARSRTNLLCTVFIVSSLLCSGYFLRDYVQKILVVVEHQDDTVIVVILVVLYVIVSMPFAWGYILINVATGYLYGMFKGIVVTFVTATLGIFIANNLIKACLSRYNGRWLIATNSFTESLDLVMSSQQQAFKIVVLSRLTPIPFGVQNAFFAVNNSLSTARYLQATCIGLLPCQILNVYLGSTFRSMEQLLADSETAQIGAIVLACQVAVAVAVTLFVIKRSRTELEAALQKVGNGGLHHRDLELGQAERGSCEVTTRAKCDMVM